MHFGARSERLPEEQLRAVASDAMADAVDAAELLDVDMDQFSRRVAPIADDLQPGRESGKPTELMVRSTRATVETGRLSRRAMMGPAKRQDLVLLFVRQPVGAAMRMR
jgi:hypothetical protein